MSHLIINSLVVICFAMVGSGCISYNSNYSAVLKSLNNPLHIGHGQTRSERAWQRIQTTYSFKIFIPTTKTHIITSSTITHHCSTANFLLS